MKKNKAKALLVFVGIISASSLSGQITNIVATDDSSFVLERVYVGALGVNSFSIDSLDYKALATIRAGVAAKLKLSRGLSIQSFFAQDFASTGNSPVISSFVLEYKAKKVLSVGLGRGVQVSSKLHRPHPVSSGGQFETFSMRSVPGGALSVMTTLTFGKTRILGSVAAVGNAAEYHLGASFAGLAISSWYRGDSHWGGAATYKSKRTNTTLVVRNDLLAGTFTLNFPKKFIGYVDAGVSTGAWGLVRAETGLLRTFKMNYLVQGLVGLGYADELRAVRGYLFVTL